MLNIVSWNAPKNRICAIDWYLYSMIFILMVDWVHPHFKTRSVENKHFRAPPIILYLSLSPTVSLRWRDDQSSRWTNGRHNCEILRAELARGWYFGTRQSVAFIGWCKTRVIKVSHTENSSRGLCARFSYVCKWSS